LNDSHAILEPEFGDLLGGPLHEFFIDLDANARAL
jgi:hypothetical protein